MAQLVNYELCRLPSALAPLVGVKCVVLADVSEWVALLMIVRCNVKLIRCDVEMRLFGVSLILICPSVCLLDLSMVLIVRNGRVWLLVVRHRQVRVIRNGERLIVLSSSEGKGLTCAFGIRVLTIWVIPCMLMLTLRCMAVRPRECVNVLISNILLRLPLLVPDGAYIRLPGRCSDSPWLSRMSTSD